MRTPATSLLRLARKIGYGLLLVAVLAAARAASTPQQVGNAVVAAWNQRDVATLARLVHPEFLRRSRESPGLQKYLATQGPRPNTLASITSGSASSAFAEVAPGRPPADLIVHLCRALDQLAPRNPQNTYADWLKTTVVVGDLAVLTYASSWKNTREPLRKGEANTEVFLRREGETWLYLWSQAVAPLFGTTWEPRKELAAPVSFKTTTFPVRTNITLLGKDLNVPIGGTVRVERSGAETKVLSIDSTLLLPPGDYEVLGQRAGYRDVKWMLRVSADLQPVDLTVDCTVPLATIPPPTAVEKSLQEAILRRR